MSLGNSLDGSTQNINTITKDEQFKDVIKYKAVAATLVRFALEDEFKGKSITDVAKMIKDKKPRNPNMTDSEIMDDEIDMEPSESGTGDNKNIIFDSVFNLDVKDKALSFKIETGIGEEITINLEMQNVTDPRQLGYEILSRAVYYGASLLVNTLPAGDTSYTNLHKVYSIWFCKNDLNLPTYKTLTGLEYIHHWSIRRSYNLEANEKVAPKEKETDLIEIIVIELDKLAHKTPKSDLDLLLNTLFFQSDKFVERVERHEKVNLTKVKKGVNNMSHMETLVTNMETLVKETAAKLGETEAKLGETETKLGETETKLGETEAKLGETEASAILGAKMIIESFKKSNPTESYLKIIEKVASMVKLNNNLKDKLIQIYKDKQ